MASIRERVLKVLKSMPETRGIDISDETTLGELRLGTHRIVDMMVSLGDEFETLIDDSLLNRSPTENRSVTSGQLIALFEEQIGQ